MPNCPNCGKPYNPGDEVCPDCGLVFPFTTDILAPSTVLQARYEIQELTHTGGMGYIYLAKDKKLYDRLCIVKQVKEPVKSDSDLQKLEEEARRMAKLSHPNVAMILDHFVEGDYYFLVVERISGKTLGEVFAQRHGQLTEEEVVNWAISICDVISYIHEEGVIHRDISPDNIMLTDKGVIKFVDFGTLRELRYITTKGTAGMGKYGYTPPEQWQGRPVPQSDIFALSATLYYLLTGSLPLSKEYLSGQGPQKQDFSPSFPPIRTKNPGVSPELEAVLQKALQLDINARYSSATELGQALKRLRKIEVTEAAVLSVDCEHLDFASVTPGSSETKSLTLKNIGSGRITAAITTTQPWIKVSPVTVDLAAESEQRVLVTVDTSGLASGFNGAGDINIVTNSGIAKVIVSLSTTTVGKPVRSPVPLPKVTGRKKQVLVLAIALIIVVPLLVIVGRNVFQGEQVSPQQPASTPVGLSQQAPPDKSLDTTTTRSPENVSAFAVEPGSLDFANIAPESSESSKFTIKNAGGSTLVVTLRTDKPWLKVVPAEIKITGDEEAIKVRVDTTGLPYGFKDSGYVSIITNRGDKQVTVTLSVAASEHQVTMTPARDWPMFCGNPQHTGATDENIAGSLTLLWKYKIGEEVAEWERYRPPAISGGKVFVGSYDNYVYCLSFDDGKLIWKYKTGNRVDSTPAVFGGRVYINGCDFYVHCLNAEDGNLIWKCRTESFGESSPTVIGGKVFVSTGAYIYCLNAEDGKVIWRTWCVTMGSSSSPAVSDGRLFTGCADDKICCFNADDGRIIWQYGVGTYVTSSAAISDGKVLIIDCQNNLYCLSAADGRLLWKYSGVPSDITPAISGNKVIVAGGDTCCIDLNNGTLIWKQGATWPGGHSEPVIAGDKVFLGLRKEIVCLDAELGEVLQQYDEIDWWDLSIAISGGRIFATADGYLYCFGR